MYNHLENLSYAVFPVQHQTVKVGINHNLTFETKNGDFQFLNFLDKLYVYSKL